ncbi:MAG: 16S rRNA (cytosine(967)-C(5))-methyltransferase RsmB, partial [Clostridiales bacterium]
ILNIIRTGIYQILFCDRIPDFAVCSESVLLAKKYGHKGSIGFVNGILRNIVRNKEKIQYPNKDKNIYEYLSIFYSIPVWIVKRWIKIFGIDFTKSILEYNLKKESKLTIRINSLKIELNDLQEMLKSDSILGRKSSIIKNALIIDEPKDIINLNLYKEGFFSIQSECSMLVTEILNPRENDFIIDLCSAPGGKTAHIAEKMNNTGKIIAMDLHKSRLKNVLENEKRLGINIIEIKENDGEILNRSYMEKADKVLVDAPCSGFGIINKRPDILFNRKEEDIKKLVITQKNILDNAAKYVKQNGIIVYSTCTIEPGENEIQIKNFLERHKNFSLESIEEFLPDKLKKYLIEDGFVTIYPHINDLDGFFIARLKRKD